MHDVKFAFRQLTKAPGFTAVAILTLALAIGVNSAVFSLINAVVLRPAVSLRPEELVALFSSRRDAVRDFQLFSHADYLALRDARDVFADVAATSITSAGVGLDGSVRRVQAFFASENYFDLLGAQPLHGRFFNAGESRPNAGIPVVVVSHNLWQQHGSRPDFVGETLLVNGRPFTVIGVAPAGFNGVLVFSRTDLWVPLGVFGDFAAGPRRDLASPQGHHLHVIARIAPGLTAATLATRLPVVAERLPPVGTGAGATGRVLHAEPPSRSNVSTQPSGGDRAVPLALGVFTMSGCVLLIACLNLANMLLARGAARSREIALRLALGATRGRIVRQLIVEGFLLAAAGGVVGLLFGTWGNDLLLHSLRMLVDSAGESLLLDVAPDARVFGVTFLFCLLATLAFSLGPAMKAARTDLIDELKLHGGTAHGPARQHGFFSLGHCLVMGQIALSLMLLFSAGLFLRGALRAAAVVPGFNASGAVVADVDFSLTRLSPEEAGRALFSTLDHIAAQPGVESAAAATFVPYGTRTLGQSVRATGATEPSFTALYTAITPAYFDAAGVSLVRGRDFTAAEAREPSAAVVIIDETLARKLFPDGDALGRHLRVRGSDREIVGLCAPHRQSNRRPNLPDRVFIPYAAGHDGRAVLVVRHAGAAEPVVASLRGILRTHFPDLPVLQVAPLPGLVENDFTVWLARLGAALFGAFGTIALLLAVVGVYGVKAYAVSRRTREIGIRMAIGAIPRDIFVLLLRQGALQVLVAVTLGVLLSIGAGRILAKMLYEVSPTDPLALTTSAALLTAATLLACYIPARRATQVDPTVALRSE